MNLVPVRNWERKEDRPCLRTKRKAGALFLNWRGKKDELSRGQKGHRF